MGDLLSFEHYRRRAERLKRLEKLYESVTSFFAAWRARKDVSLELAALNQAHQEVEKLKFTLPPPKDPA